mmetsp:Transcript_43910/g.108640  ORF Transcript_43910/g.108640 Transcript_43910/m.108640 type:complete len:289 (+) Transcript_43910:345-1211(+)
MQAGACRRVTPRNSLRQARPIHGLRFPDRVAALERVRPQPIVCCSVNRTSQVPKQPDCRPEAEPHWKLRGHLDHPTCEAEFVPGLNHAAGEGLVHCLGVSLVRYPLSFDPHSVYRARVRLEYPGLRVVGAIDEHHRPAITHGRHRVGRVAHGRGVGVVTLVKRRPALIVAVREVATGGAEFVAEHQFVLRAVGIHRHAVGVVRVAVAPAALLAVGRRAGGHRAGGRLRGGVAPAQIVSAGAVRSHAQGRRGGPQRRQHHQRGHPHRPTESVRHASAQSHQASLRGARA